MTAGISTSDILGGMRLGSAPPAHAEYPHWPEQSVVAPLLGCAEDLVREQWATDDGDCWSGEAEAIHFRRCREILFGVIELDEHAFACGPFERGLQNATREAYGQIFRLLSAQGLPHLWRVWNYLAEINIATDGLERYRQFNIGRHDAFVAFGRAATGEVPAACAIGLRQGRLSIAFIAGRVPARAVENPRQVSAYHYPPAYGPRSPTFSRATLVSLPQQELLFVSGTASIVGHSTAHVGDASAQCSETLNNVEAVVTEANRLSSRAIFRLPMLTYRVYLRRETDLSAVRQVLAERLGNPEILYVQADICRRDLLIEVEAMASERIEKP